MKSEPEVSLSHFSSQLQALVSPRFLDWNYSDQEVEWQLKSLLKFKLQRAVVPETLLKRDLGKKI